AVFHAADQCCLGPWPGVPAKLRTSSENASPRYVVTQRKLLQHIDARPEEPAIAKQEILLDVDPNFRREGAAAVTLLQCPQVIVLPGGNHQIRDQRHGGHAMLRREMAQPNLR